MTTATAFRLDEQVLIDLKKIAKEQERSVNWLVNNILKNFESVVFDGLKMNSLPFNMLRDISFVRTLKQEIRKSGKKAKTSKTKNGWFN